MDDDLDTYLNSLPDRILAELRGVVQEQAEMLSGAQRVALQALETSPAETGNLEESCVAVPGKDDLEWIVQAGGDLTTKEIRESSGVAYDYAEAFEYGTSKQPARPFFWPTYNEKKDEIRSAIAAGVERVLRR